MRKRIMKKKKMKKIMKKIMESKVLLKVHKVGERPCVL